MCVCVWNLEHTSAWLCVYVRVCVYTQIEKQLCARTTRSRPCSSSCRFSHVCSFSYCRAKASSCLWLWWYSFRRVWSLRSDMKCRISFESIHSLLLLIVHVFVLIFHYALLLITTRVCTFVCVCTRACTLVCVCTRAHTRVRASVHHWYCALLFTTDSVCMCVCLYVYSVPQIWVHTHRESALIITEFRMAICIPNCTTHRYNCWN